MYIGKEDLKVGDKVVCIKSDAFIPGITEGELYTILEIVIVPHDEPGIIVEDDYNNQQFYYAKRFTKFYQIEKETEMTLTSTMNAEQIRDEILRIDVRIEEAKKDIENAENERNSLVEKLRERGFELTHNDSENDIHEEMNFKIGDQVRVIGKTHGHYFSIGEIVKVTEVNPHDYQCTGSNGQYWWLNPAEIEKI